jgi:hypothetical protein
MSCRSKGVPFAKEPRPTDPLAPVEKSLSVVRLDKHGNVYFSRLVVGLTVYVPVVSERRDATSALCSSSLVLSLSTAASSRPAQATTTPHVSRHLKSWTCEAGCVADQLSSVSQRGRRIQEG